MHKVYRLNSGIEFRWDVKDYIIAIIAIAVLGYVATHIEEILAVMIAGF